MIIPPVVQLNRLGSLLWASDRFGSIIVYERSPPNDDAEAAVIYLLILGLKAR